MKLAFSIAMRFLKSNKSQTVLISLGIAVGVSVQIFIGLLIQGLQADLIDSTIGRTSHITVTAATGNEIGDYAGVIQESGEVDQRIINVSASLDRAVFIGKGEESRSVLMRGLDLAASEGIYRTSESIVSGELPSAAGQAAIGRELAEELRIMPGDALEVLNTEGNISQITISGIFDFGVSALNRSWMITNPETVRSTYSLGDVAGAVEMQVKDIFAAAEIAGVLSEKLGDGYDVQNWQDSNQELLSGLNGQSISSLMIQIFVLVAVVLAIASVLAISVMQKSRQIGILKAMGIKDSTASLIFLLQGAVLGLLGAAAGLLLGWALLFMFTSFARNPDGTPVINIAFNGGFMALSALIAVIAATGASLVPAKRSSKLSPIEVIRNG